MPGRAVCGYCFLAASGERGFCRLFRTLWIPPRLVLRRSREGIRGGVACGHGMAVPACGRCVCGGRPRGEVPPAGLPVVRRADDVLVRVPASCPGGGPLPEDLRAAAALSAVPGEPCAVAGVRAG